jgi:hypothetical protein
MTSQNEPTRPIRYRRTKQLFAALKRARIAAARKAMQFGQLLYIVHRGKVVGLDPREVLSTSGAA